MIQRGDKHGKSQGKPQWHLLPDVTQVIRVLMHGAGKYGEDNWCKGMPYNEVFDGVQRHMWAWWRGEDLDGETGLSHLAHAACGVLFLLTYTGDDRIAATYDDRPRVGCVPPLGPDNPGTPTSPTLGVDRGHDGSPRNGGIPSGGDNPSSGDSGRSGSHVRVVCQSGPVGGYVLRYAKECDSTRDGAPTNPSPDPIHAPDITALGQPGRGAAVQSVGEVVGEAPNGPPAPTRGDPE